MSAWVRVHELDPGFTVKTLALSCSVFFTLPQGWTHNLTDTVSRGSTCSLWISLKKTTTTTLLRLSVQIYWSCTSFCLFQKTKRKCMCSLNMEIFIPAALIKDWWMSLLRAHSSKSEVPVWPSLKSPSCSVFAAFDLGLLKLPLSESMFHRKHTSGDVSSQRPWSLNTPLASSGWLNKLQTRRRN